MLDNTIALFSQNNAVWGILLGMIGLVVTIFTLYYLVCTIWLIAASLYSGIKMLPDNLRTWREDAATTYDTSWGEGELGFTMPDGGEPIDEEEEKEENDKEASS